MCERYIITNHTQFAATNVSPPTICPPRYIIVPGSGIQPPSQFVPQVIIPQLTPQFVPQITIPQFTQVTAPQFAPQATTTQLVQQAEPQVNLQDSQLADQGLVAEGPIGYLLGSGVRIFGPAIGGAVSSVLGYDSRIGAGIGGAAGQVIGSVLNFIPF